MRLSKSEASEYGKRANRAHRQKRWCIEGEHVTVPDIARRLGICETTARKRFQREQKSDRPVLWINLED